jgi:hypothetical protein
VLKTIESIKWYLWHGNVFQALRHLQFVEMDLEGAAFEKQEETTRKLLKAVDEFSTYIQRNRGFIPNYGERYRNGERISTGFVESAVNQVVSKRQEAADAPDATRSALVAAGPHSRPQRRIHAR